MSFKIDKENQSKNYNIDSVNTDSDTVKVKRDDTESGPGPEPKTDVFEFAEEDQDEDLGIRFIANEDKKVDDEEERLSEPSEQQSDIFMKEQPPYIETESIPDDGNFMSQDEIQQQKAYYLCQLKRLEKKGHSSIRCLGLEHPLREIKGEVFKIRKEIETDRGINYCRQGLMFCVSTIEMLNNKYDPMGVDLDGWSNVIMADKENYDDVFEELYEKYNSKIGVSPEIKLMSMIAGSAMMFHLQKSIVNRHVNNNGGGMFSSLANMMSKPKTSQPTMNGPSAETEDLLKTLNADDFSDASSVVSEKNISIPQPKKRGRKPKTK